MACAAGRRLLLGILIPLAGGATGCSCGEDVEFVEGKGRLCVSAVLGTAACDPDNTELDWGSPIAGEKTTLVVQVRNADDVGALRIDDVRVTDTLGTAELFDLRLCWPTCDEQLLGMPTTLGPRGVALLEITFDATDFDGVMPTESLEIVSNDSADDVEPIGVYLRPFVGVLNGCLPGRTDANGDKTDGCECAPSVDGNEYCDALDNDCDGSIDEDVVGGGIVCDTGLVGRCADGAVECNDGALACVPVAELSDEVCDGLDNDCDGSSDEENTWLPFNEGLSGGTMTTVEYDPRFPDVAYTVTGTRVYRSDNGGSSFTHVGDSLGAINSFGFPTNDPTAVLGASTGGLLRSTDGGATWSELSLSGFNVISILVHPADPGRVFVGTIGGGIFRSTNGGQGFTAMNWGVPPSGVAALVGDPLDADHVVAGLRMLNAQGTFNFQGEIIETQDGGATWNTVATGIGDVRSVSGCVNEPGTLYASSYLTGMLKSVDGGTVWNTVALDGARVTAVAASPADCDSVYAATRDTGVYFSSQGGANIGGPFVAGLDVEIPGDAHLAAHPTSPSTALISNHSSVFRSTTSAASWLRVQNIGATTIRAVRVGADAPNVVWLSTWGQGIWSRTGSADWERTVIPRDWSLTNEPDPQDGQRVVIGSGEVWRSEDAGSSFEATVGPQNVFAIAYDHNDADVLYIGTQLGGVWKSVDGGDVFVEENDGIPAPWPTGNCVCRDVRTVLVDQANASTVYAGTHLEGLFVSTDGADNWQPADPNLAGESILCLEQDNAGDLFACVAGEGIWRSADGGQTFAKITDGLSHLNNTSYIHIDEATGDMYVASDGAIFRTVNQIDWVDMDNQCLPAVGAMSPTIMEDQGQRLLLVGTGGAGVFALPLQ